MQSKAATVAAYLKEQSPGRRAALQKVRKLIRAVAPELAERRPTVQHNL
jgi:hypothetical protein